MPALIINLKPDGTVTVAPCDPTPEQLQGGQDFQSVDEALKAVEEALESPDQEAQEQQAPGGDEGADAAGTPQQQDQAMGTGYDAARRGH
jgi:hypothetical protein